MIPIFRGKKIDSDEFVEGYYWKSPETLESFIAAKDDLTKTLVHIKIDPTTLSMHFHDTNIKELFFGLDNGKGASTIEALFVEDNTPFKGVAMHTHHGYVFYDKNDDWVHISKLWNIKVIGIQK